MGYTQLSVKTGELVKTKTKTCIRSRKLGTRSLVGSNLTREQYLMDMVTTTREQPYPIPVALTPKAQP